MAESSKPEATVEGNVQPGDTVEVLPEGAPADATIEGNVQPGDEAVVEGQGEPQPKDADGAPIPTPEPQPGALTGAGDPEGAALPVEGEAEAEAPYEHPEPTPLAFVHQDNVTEPGVQVTRAPSTETGNIEESRHEAAGDVAPAEIADEDASPPEA